jgi:tetratricopeptide (TPR) repeat protein
MPAPSWYVTWSAAALLGLGAAGWCSAQTPADLSELIIARDTARQAGDLQTAQATALEIIRRLESRQGLKAMALTEPLLELARIHRALGNGGEAERTYLRVLDIIQAEQGKAGPDLITPYRELAQSLMDDERFEAALDTLEEARSISRRNFGLFNMGQVQLFDDLSRAYLGLNEGAEAQQMQEEKVTLAVRNFGADDLRVAPYREQLADYYQRSRLKVAAREEHRKALAIYTEQAPADSSAQLRALSHILRLNFVLLGDEDEHLRIAQLLDEGQLSQAEHAATLALLGDFYFVRVEDRAEAERYWSEAYRRSRNLPAEDMAAARFDKPVMLDFVPPLNEVDRSSPRRKRAAWGQLTAVFSVDADGRAGDVEVQMSMPNERLARRYVERIQATHFRPRLSDSVPVATPRVRLTHAYRYFVD